MKMREPALVDLAREVVLAAATSLVKSGEDRPDPRLGWEPPEDGLRVQAHRLGEQLGTELGLPAVDAWLVLLCVTVELFPDVSAAMGILGEDPQQQLPTPLAFARLMAGLGAGYGTALCAGLPGAPAERSGRVERLEPPPGRPWTAAPMRATLRELRRWLGVSAPTPLPLLPTFSWTAADPAYVRSVATMIPEGLVIRSADSRAVRQLLVDLGSVLGAPLSWVGEEPPETVLDAPGLAVLDYSSGQRQVPWSLLRRLHGVKSLIIWVGAGAGAPGWSVVEPPPLGVVESRRIWTALAPQAVELAPWFLISAEELREAVDEARNQRRLARTGGEPGVEEIRDRVLATGGRRMGRAVERIPSQQGLDTLVVAPDLRMQLDDMVAWYRAMPHVEARYRQGPGRGLTCLFAGPPGTGKTFAAGCLASTLGLNLYRVDLSQVVSKYIGETEKALAQVFAEAESGHGILLFDEADALFGKRSEVKDAHDRYANVEVSYLLARMDSFVGLSILTTNLRGNLDPAFLRRMRFVLEFALPDREQRRLLWRKHLPDPSQWHPDLDLELFVDRFPFSGGAIHNVGLAAAHATVHGAALSPELLCRAVARELEKAGMARSRSDFGPLARYLWRAP